MNAANLWKRIIIAVLLALIVVVLSLFYRGIWMKIAVLVLLVVITLMLVIFYRSVIRPMYKAADVMSEGNVNEFEKEFVRIKINYPLIRGWIDILEDFIIARIQKNNAGMLDKQSELTALQSQINPHFLYNTLDTIRSEALLNDDNNTAAMIETLASFFRYSISRKGTMVRLREELHNIENYMKIQQYQFNDRFSLNIIVDEEDEEAYDVFVPRLILQPIVENALNHGLKDITENGIITIEACITDRDLVVTVSDNGCGMELEELEKLNERIHSNNVWNDDISDDKGHSGIGLPNINKRIQLLYGKRYGVNIYSSPGQGTDTEITVPIRDEKVEEN